MNLENKIDEIRRQPEHVRVRYAWIFAIVFTLFVVLIWIISLLGQKKEAPAEIINSQDDIINSIDVNQQKDSIKSATDELKKSLENSNINKGQ